MRQGVYPPNTKEENAIFISNSGEIELGTAAQAFNPSPWEPEPKRPKFPAQLWLHNNKIQSQKVKVRIEIFFSYVIYL